MSNGIDLRSLRGALQKKQEAGGVQHAAETEGKKEWDFQSMLGYAAPLVGSMLLPGIGGLLAPMLTSALGGLGAGGGALSALVSGGSGILGTLGKVFGGTVGQKLLQDTMEGGGRLAGLGGKEEVIRESGGEFGGTIAGELASQFGRSKQDTGAEWLSALTSGVSMGGGAEVLGELGSKFGAKAKTFGEGLFGKMPGTIDPASAIQPPMVKGQLPDVASQLSGYAAPLSDPGKGGSIASELIGGQIPTVEDKLSGYAAPLSDPGINLQTSLGLDKMPQDIIRADGTIDIEKWIQYGGKVEDLPTTTTSAFDKKSWMDKYIE